MPQAPQNAIHAPDHFGGRAAREGQQQDPGRVHPVGDEPCHAMYERSRLARACSSDNQQRAAAVRGRTSLLGIEAGQ
jgi:hypothetical protein